MMPVKRSQNWLPGIFNDFFGNEWLEKVNTTAPAINIIENDKEYSVEVAAPGLTKDDFTIKVDKDNQLTVAMERKSENNEKDKNGRYLRREFSYTQFQQTMILPDNVDADKIEAEVKDGVLRIDLPKRPVTEEVKKLKEVKIK